MNYKILVIDDDEPIHIFIDKMLESEYAVLHAYNSQEGIDILSKEPVNLVLSDIHMPGMSGLNFLESLLSDADRKNIPVLIMTSLPTVEKEKIALELGAADFIDKGSFFKDEKDEVLNRIQMRLVTNIDVPELADGLKADKKQLVSELMEEVMTGDFFTVSRKLCVELRHHFSMNHLFFWTVRSGEPQIILSIGSDSFHDFGPKDLKEESSFHNFLKEKKPYLTNHVYDSETGIFGQKSKEENLPSEIGVPLYAISDRELIKNRMSIPKGTELFGYLVMKRNTLITTEEFRFISRFVIQSGTILWRLFTKI